MNHIRLRAAVAAIWASAALAVPVLAAEVDSGSIYCFSQEDFSGEGELAGICVTQLPDSGEVLLNGRVICAGDVLTAQQLAALTFRPEDTQDDQLTELEYLPVFADGVAEGTAMAIAIRGRKDQAPVAEDSAMETYKNLPGEAMLRVKDPEGQAMSYTVVRQPKRGEVAIREDGSFIYTPKKNKVGVDSFTYTASDPAGNVSREATVTITILKPTDSRQYEDTVGESCRFAAEWMKNTGIFVAERVGGNSCFRPDKEVSRGEFLTMLVGALEIPVEDEQTIGYTDDAPAWLKPYLAAAMRNGLTLGWPDGDAFCPENPITGEEAAVMIQNALKLPMPEETETAVVEAEQSQWAAAAVATLQENGITCGTDQILTRSDAAQILYQAHQLASTAPGTQVRNRVS